MIKNKLTCLVALLCLALLPTAASAKGKVRPNSLYREYVRQYKDIAIEEMEKYGIPASITLAQGLLESGAGRSDLSLRGNNHFGIKCHGWDGRTISHDDDERGECFRAYDSPRESFEDHSLFLARRDRYRELFLLASTDYKGWARGLKRCGYATNPHYAQNLIDIIEAYELYRYDNATTRRVEASAALTATSAQGVKRKVSGAHALARYNDNVYCYARQGDTWTSLARELGMTAATLAEVNERDRSETLREGDIIYTKKKAKRAEKRFKNHPHTVQAGQSLYDLSQLYGVQLKHLIKKNPWLKAKGYQVSVGDKVTVY